MQNGNYFYNPTYLSAFKGLISRKAKQKKYQSINLMMHFSLCRPYLRGDNGHLIDMMYNTGFSLFLWINGVRGFHKET